jgi:hypothetical protein
MDAKHLGDEYNKTDPPKKVRRRRRRRRRRKGLRPVSLH